MFRNKKNGSITEKTKSKNFYKKRKAKVILRTRNHSKSWPKQPRIRNSHNPNFQFLNKWCPSNWVEKTKRKWKSNSRRTKISERFSWLSRIRILPTKFLDSCFMIIWSQISKSVIMTPVLSAMLNLIWVLRWSWPLLRIGFKTSRMPLETGLRAKTMSLLLSRLKTWTEVNHMLTGCSKIL